MNKKPRISVIDYIKGTTLGVQHVLAMFGSTVLVPFITGMDVSLALLCAGIGTLLFHLVTKGIVPVFLGSSFAFIPAVIIVLTNYNPGYLKGGIICAGLVYIIFSMAFKYIKTELIMSFFPAIVVGPVIISIGLKLVPVGLSMSGYSSEGINYQNIALALVSLFTMVIVSFLQKSFFRYVPILSAIVVGYIVAIFMGAVDFSLVKQASWFGFSVHAREIMFTLPKFSLNVITLVAPIALVTLMEHLGDIQANGSVVGKNFLKNPGLKRTLFGDALALISAGFLGGPANTVYGENTGVLAATKNYNPQNLRIAAVMAILLAFCGKITAFIKSLPTPIMGGISIILFGLIAAIGLRVLGESDKVDFKKYKHLIIASVIIILGVFVDAIPVTKNFAVSGLFIATVTGIILNKLLPEN